MKSFLIIVLSILLFIALAVAGIMGVGRLLSEESVILTSTSCSPPCWNSIYPGQEDPFAVFEIINSLKGVDTGSIMLDSDREDRITEIYWYFQRPAPDAQGVVYFLEERVEAISILTINSLNLGDLIEKLGKPESYWIEKGHREFNDYLKISLLYPKNGYTADVLIDLTGDETSVILKDSTPVFRVTYFDPMEFETLLEGRILIDTPYHARTGGIVPWTGLGDIYVEEQSP